MAGSDTDQHQIDFSFLVEHWWASDGWIEVWSIPVFWISILLKSVGAQRTACRHRRSWSSLSLLEFSFVDVSLWNPLFCEIYQMRLVRSPASQPGKFARFTRSLVVHPRKSTRLEASLASGQEPARRRMMVMRCPRSSARYRRRGHGQRRPHCEGFCGKSMVLFSEEQS